MNTLHTFLAAGLLAACGTSGADTLQLSGVGVGSFSVPVTSWKQARFGTTARQQYDFSCGSAAVATLLTHHYGDPVTEQAVFEDMFALGEQAKIQREGFSLLDIKAYLGGAALWPMLLSCLCPSWLSRACPRWC